MGKINSLKKIRKKEEAFFGKDLQFLRIAFFEPNSYKHFQKGFEIYQKLELICSKSKFKKEVFTNFKDEFKKGFKILELDEQEILETKKYWEITKIWTRLKPHRKDAKKWFREVIEIEKYNLPPNSDKETVEKAREKVIKKAFKIKSKEEKEKAFEQKEKEAKIQREIQLEKEKKFTKEKELKSAQKKILLLEKKNEELLDKKQLERKKYLKNLYKKVLKKINFSNTKDVLSRRSILYEFSIRDDIYEIKIRIEKFWNNKIEKSFLVKAFSDVLKVSEDNLRIYYSGEDDEFDYFIDDFSLKKIIELEKWTLIEKKHSEVELGNIYVLSNQSMPNIFKIGFTSKNPSQRAKDIRSSLQIDSNFVIEKSWITKNPFEVEQKIFNSLSQYRDGNSEFFECDLKKIFSIVERNLQKLNIYS